MPLACVKLLLNKLNFLQGFYTRYPVFDGSNYRSRPEYKSPLEFVMKIFFRFIGLYLISKMYLSSIMWCLDACVVIIMTQMNNTSVVSVASVGGRLQVHSEILNI